MTRRPATVWQDDVDRVVEALEEGPATIKEIHRRLGLEKHSPAVLRTVFW